MQEKIINKATNVRSVALKRKIINLGTNPIETKFVADLIEVKDNEIQRIKKKLKMPTTQHTTTKRTFRGSCFSSPKVGITGGFSIGGGLFKPPHCLHL